MKSEGFLRRWSRLKSDPGVEVPPPPGSHAHSEAEPGARVGNEVTDVQRPPVPAAPTLQDAMHLTPESDYSAFVARGVDKAVRRLAMKKLFADPHFNQPDGLDIFMGDYNRADPLPAPMLAALRQAQDFLQEQVATGDDEPNDTGIADVQDGSIHAAGCDSPQTENSELGRNES